MRLRLLFVSFAVLAVALLGGGTTGCRKESGSEAGHHQRNFAGETAFNHRWPLVPGTTAETLPEHDVKRLEERQLAARAGKTTSRRKISTTKKVAPKSTTTVAKSNTTSYNLIQIALNRGQINRQTAALYQLYAQFGDPLLPARFRVGATSVRPGGPDTPHAVVNILRFFKQLTPAQQTQVKSYFVPPNHGGSWWQKKFAPKSPNGSKPTKRDLALRKRSDGYGEELYGHSGQELHKRAPIDVFSDPTLLLREWDSVASSDGNVRVWFQVRYASTDKKLATDMAAESVKIWAKHKALMVMTPIPDSGDKIDGRGGDSRLDISLVDGGSNTLPYGRSCTSAAPSYIMFNRGVGANWKEELAHEMFHAFQYSFRVKTNCMAIDYAWLVESTAQWSEDWVYPGNADQHRAAKHWMDFPETSLDDDSKIGPPRRYGGYFVWHYANLILNQPRLILDVWNKASAMEQLEALNAVFPGGMKKHWPQIALYSFNGGSAEMLKTRGLTRTANVIGGGQTPIEFGLDGANTLAVPMPVDLPYLSASYLYLDLSKDPNLRSFVFYNGLRAKLDKRVVKTNVFASPFDTHVWELKGDNVKTRGAAIWAMWRVAGKTTWEKAEDWSDAGFIRFCRQKSAEKLEEMVIVFSNSEWKDKKYKVGKYGSLDSVLFASNIFCHAAKGPTRFNGVWKSGHWTAEGTNVGIKTGVSKQKPGVIVSPSTYQNIYVDGGAPTVPSDCNITISTNIPGLPGVKDPVKCLPYYIAPTRFFPDGSGSIKVDASGTEECNTTPPTTAIVIGKGTFPPTDNKVAYLDIMDTSVSGSAHRAYRGTFIDMQPTSVQITGGCLGIPKDTVGSLYLETARDDGKPTPVSNKDDLSGTVTRDGGTIQWSFKSAPEV